MSEKLQPIDEMIVDDDKWYERDYPSSTPYQVTSDQLIALRTAADLLSKSLEASKSAVSVVYSILDDISSTYTHTHKVVEGSPNITLPLSPDEDGDYFVDFEFVAPDTPPTNKFQLCWATFGGRNKYLIWYVFVDPTKNQIVARTGMGMSAEKKEKKIVKLDHKLTGGETFDVCLAARVDDERRVVITANNEVEVAITVEYANGGIQDIVIDMPWSGAEDHILHMDDATIQLGYPEGLKNPDEQPYYGGTFKW